MIPNPGLMQAIEQLDYTVTVGDVAAQAGLDVKEVQRELMNLATVTRGHLLVADSGDIVYRFPENFRFLLRQRFWRLRLQEWWGRIWPVLFYLIRISFAILLLISIVVIYVAIFALLVSSQRDGERQEGRSGDNLNFLIPYFAFRPGWFWILSFDYTHHPQLSQRRQTRKPEMNFLEAVFSFLFGDGNPNANLEAERWQAIATVIGRHQGAVVAEQIAPYLDEIEASWDKNYEDYMLPVLLRFNGQPEVSPVGELVYHFPELQTRTAQHQTQWVRSFLEEKPWPFSAATSGQITGAIALGVINLGGALVLGTMLQQIGGVAGILAVIYGLLLAYGLAFLATPLIRYFWLQRRNRAIGKRNQARRARVQQLETADTTLQQKLAYAKEFALETVISQTDIAYTTEKSLLEQEVEQADKIDADWQRRLDESTE